MDRAAVQLMPHAQPAPGWSLQPPAAAQTANAASGGNKIEDMLHSMASDDGQSGSSAHNSSDIMEAEGEDSSVVATAAAGAPLQQQGKRPSDNPASSSEGHRKRHKSNTASATTAATTAAAAAEGAFPASAATGAAEGAALPDSGALFAIEEMPDGTKTVKSGMVFTKRKWIPIHILLSSVRCCFPSTLDSVELQLKFDGRSSSGAPPAATARLDFTRKSRWQHCSLNVLSPALHRYGFFTVTNMSSSSNQQLTLHLQPPGAKQTSATAAAQHAAAAAIAAITDWQVHEMPGPVLKVVNMDSRGRMRVYVPNSLIAAALPGPPPLPFKVLLSVWKDGSLLGGLDAVNVCRAGHGQEIVIPKSVAVQVQGRHLLRFKAAQPYFLQVHFSSSSSRAAAAAAAAAAGCDTAATKHDVQQPHQQEPVPVRGAGCAGASNLLQRSSTLSRDPGQPATGSLAAAATAMVQSKIITAIPYPASASADVQPAEPPAVPPAPSSVGTSRQQDVAPALAAGYGATTPGGNTRCGAVVGGVHALCQGSNATDAGNAGSSAASLQLGTHCSGPSQTHAALAMQSAKAAVAAGAAGGTFSGSPAPWQPAQQDTCKLALPQQPLPPAPAAEHAAISSRAARPAAAAGVGGAGFAGGGAVTSNGQLGLQLAAAAADPLLPCGFVLAPFSNVAEACEQLVLLFKHLRAPDEQLARLQAAIKALAGLGHSRCDKLAVFKACYCFVQMWVRWGNVAMVQQTVDELLNAVLD